MEQILERILIDTNIIIQLEDNKKTETNYSELNRICAEFGVKIFIHKSSYEDIERDKDKSRKEIALSKLEKYPHIPKTPNTTKEKEQLFGKIKKPNDEVDTDLLYSLHLNTADILITEDKGIKQRVKGTKLEPLVLKVDEALSKLKKIFGSVFVNYKHVQDKTCTEYSFTDPFFDSLKQDYNGFECWFKDCIAKQRHCWVIEQESGLSGMVIYKDESRKVPKDKQELDDLKVPGNNVLKLCTFKVEETSRGEKFGEQLLKKTMDYAYRNNYDSMYLTVLPKHTKLIHLITELGFIESPKTNGEEQVYYKYTKVISLEEKLPIFEFHRRFWPSIMVTDTNKYMVPIKPVFHKRLFPEADEHFNHQYDLQFDDTPQTPGNAIQKIYICNAQIKSMEPGDILLFYRSEDKALTSIGVLQEFRKIDNFEDLKEMAGRRSVYSDDELQDIVQQKSNASALNFFYSEHLDTPIEYKQLKECGLLNGPPQSITRIDSDRFNTSFLSLLNTSDKEIFCYD